MKNKTTLSFLFVLVILLNGCAFDPGTPVSQTETAQVFVFPGATEKRLISEEQIPQNNCNGSAESSQTIQKEHTITYSLELGTEITVSAEGKASIPELGEIAVGAEVAGNYQVGYGQSEMISRSITVAAKEGTNIQHTIRQYEIWEVGEILIVVGEVNKRLPYSFRKDFSIEQLEPANIGCPVDGISESPTQISSTPVIENSNSSSFRLCSNDEAGSAFIQTDASTGKTRIQLLSSGKAFYISTDPTIITFSPESGLSPISSANPRMTFVILGKDVPGLEWIELQPGFAFTACVYSLDQFPRAQSDAEQDMNNKKADNVSTEFYVIDGVNVQLLESFP